MSGGGHILRGPADPEVFRIKVGRYSHRWYHDPLPGCDVAPAAEPDSSWPSVSIVKNSFPKFLGDWIATQAAEYAYDNREAWQGLERSAAVPLIATASDRTRDAAALRGTNAHNLLEQIGAGIEPNPNLVPDAAPYFPVLRQLVADLSPEWVLSEVVAIRRGIEAAADGSTPATLGHGGTLDAAWRLDVGPLSGLYLLDFKTRKPGKHDAYEDNAIQLGAYGAADYYIVGDGPNGNPRRIPVPEFAGGLIITITPEDYRLHPVDLVEAKVSWEALRYFHERVKTRTVGKHVVVERREVMAGAPTPAAATPSDPFDGLVAANPAADASDLIAQHRTDETKAQTAGRVAAETPATETPEPSPSSSSPASEARRTWAYMRLVAITTAVPTAPIQWPSGVATFRQIREEGAPPHTDAEIDAIVKALQPIESAARLPFPDEDPKVEEAVEAAREAKRLAEESARAAAVEAAAARAPIPGDDERVQSLIARLSALPDDLLAVIEAELAGDGPAASSALTSGRCNAGHLDTLASWLTVMEERVAERAERDAALLSDLAGLPGLDAEACLSAIRVLVASFPPDGAGADLAADLVDAVVIGALVFDTSGPTPFGISDAAASALVSASGGKQAFLTDAKHAARTLGLRVPTSTAAALADPVLVAVMAAGGVETEGSGDVALPPALTAVPGAGTTTDLPAGASTPATALASSATPLDAA